MGVARLEGLSRLGYIRDEAQKVKSEAEKKRIREEAISNLDKIEYLTKELLPLKQGVLFD
jgi:hypothetical protein